MGELRLRLVFGALCQGTPFLAERRARWFYGQSVWRAHDLAGSRQVERRATPPVADVAEPAANSEPANAARKGVSP
jgi:hypothetical protein